MHQEQNCAQKKKRIKVAEKKAGYCYCGKDRNFNIVELLCANCNRWCHEPCIGYQLGKLVPFITNYMFMCKNCSTDGLESFQRFKANIPQMCITAIANMRQTSLKEGKPKSVFSRDNDIIPFLEQYWEAMTTMPRRATQSWYSTVQRCLLKGVQIIFTYEEHAENGAMFGLMTSDLTQIKPSYEAWAKLVPDCILYPGVAEDDEESMHEEQNCVQIEKRIQVAEEKAGYCYCGKDRNFNIVELLCANCNRWFHESCIGYQLGKLVPFITNYVFMCKNCSNSGLESFRRHQATIPQMCITAIANMRQTSLKEGKPKSIFSKDNDIIPFLEQYWEAMTTMPRRATQSWYSTVQRSLLKDVQIIFTYEEHAENGAMFGLMSSDLSQIKPSYETCGKLGGSRQTEDGQASLSKNNRQNKRKLPGTDSGPTGKKGRPSSDITANVKLPAHGYPLEHPFNKDGYRYILAEPDPHAPFRQEFDESSDWAGKPIPGWLYRTLVPNSVLLALHDRAPQLKISEDRLGVTGEKGYCMVRATHSVNRGRWYFEITIEEMPEGSATRLGWGQEYANLQAPLGYDKFGYSWRSRKGTRFTESHGKHYSEAYVVGDTLGFLIDLPEEKEIDYLPNTFKDRPLVKFKSHLYYEDKDKIQETLKNLRIAPGSKIEYFKNGKSNGVAFTDIYAGSYYPTISIHKSASVSANFGPTLKYPEILTNYKAKAMYDRAEELICEQSLSDVLYLTENEGRLRLDNFNA